MIYAPVIIPTVARYKHFRNCLESLARCNGAERTDVFVAVDYPARKQDQDGYVKIKEYLNQCGNLGFKSLNITYRETNYFFSGKGNGASMVKELENRYDRYIMSEDDNIFSPNFLDYMNQCLEKFKDDDDVVMVQGYAYPIKWDVSEGATCLKQNVNASMWGVGFWMKKRSYVLQYLQSGQMLDDLNTVVRDRRYLNMIDASQREYIPAALSPWRRSNRFMFGTSDIGMRAFLAVAGKYSVMPVISKVRNQGFDGSGVFCQTTETGQNGDTAGTYNYSQQPIDESTSFDLVLDAKNNMSENRNRLNRFDLRTPAQMRRTRLYMWLMTHIGIWAGKACATLLFPYDITVKIFRKVWRKL